MALVRWEPFRDLLTLQDRMNRLFEESFGRKQDIEGTYGENWMPSVDIYETENEVVFAVELPGVEQKDVDIQVKDNNLLIKGDRKLEKEVNKENYHRMERSYGMFQRTFMLPNYVDRDNIKATFKSGVLRVIIPKCSETKPKQIAISSEE